MRHIIILCLILASPALAGEYGSRALSGWFNVATPDGWQGRRYMDGSMIIAEEFDVNGDGRIDVWRFYRRGILTSEERDTNGDGRVDLVSRYDPDTGLVTAVLRDTNKRGVNDIEIERTGNRRWVIYEDRNLDGTTARIVYVNAPADLFERHAIDPATTVDISSAVPRTYWHEMWSDDGYTGSITDYFRYNNRGFLSHYGQWNGRRIVWNRCPPDFVPRPVTPTIAQDRFAPPAVAVQPTQPLLPAPGPVGQAGPVRDPFDLSAGTADVDPYYGLADRPAQPQQPIDGGTAMQPAPGEDPFFAPAAPGPMPSQPAYIPGTVSTEGSAARAIPARMRPPGQSRSR